MIIVFANMEEKHFDIYSESGKTSVPFIQASLIKHIAGKQQILYVTSATYTTLEDLISLADSAGGEEKNEPLYIHTTKIGCLFLSEINMTFSSPADFKSIEDIGEDCIKRQPLLNLIRAGELEIVSMSRAKRIKARYNAEHQLIVQKQQQQSQRNTQNNSTATEHTEGLTMVPIGGNIKSDDVIPIDLEKKSFGGGGSLANESSLLRD